MSSIFVTAVLLLTKEMLLYMLLTDFFPLLLLVLPNLLRLLADPFLLTLFMLTRESLSLELESPSTLFLEADRLLLFLHLDLLTEEPWHEDLRILLPAVFSFSVPSTFGLNFWMQ